MIELSYDDVPDDVVDKINEELSSHNLIIKYDGAFDDDGVMTYKLVKLK